MISVTTHFNEIAAQVRAVLPSLRDEELAGSGIDLAHVPPANRAAWNVRGLNCYSYATGNRQDDGYPGATYDRQHPLRRRETPLIFDLMQGGPQDFFRFVDCVQDGLRKDGLIPLGNKPDFSQPGTLIAAFVAEGQERQDVKLGAAEEHHDVHFYTLRRLDEEIEGVVRPQLTWAHKMGYLPVEFCRAGADRAGDISDPAAFFESARKEGYNYFAGFFLVPPPKPQTDRDERARWRRREYDW